MGQGSEMSTCIKNSGVLPSSPLLTEKQVSILLNISVHTLRYWRHCGDGPNYIKLGKLVRYHAIELEAYVQRQTCVSKARATTEDYRVAH
jgi:predicted DNA-binding transcriptional regulator AlpA